MEFGHFCQIAGVQARHLIEMLYIVSLTANSGPVSGIGGHVLNEDTMLVHVFARQENNGCHKAKAIK